MRLQLIRVALAAVAIATFTETAAVADEAPLWRITTDTFFYTDTDNVLVVSPQVAVHRAVDDDGGEASARVVVDAVSAASVDVVSQATNRFFEIRTEADLGFSMAVGKYLPSVSYRYSHEPDYQSHGVGVGISRELGSSDTVLAGNYNLSLDTVGFTGTPTSAFSESLVVHNGNVSLTQVLGPNTLVRGVYNLSVQKGDMEKPYRFVPLFDAASVALADSFGARIDLSNFDQLRLPFRPGENVPNLRVGNAFGIRALRYLSWLPGSARLDYQFFADSWGIIAHTAEPAVSVTLTSRQTLSAYGRLYFQQAANFWKRLYVVEPGTVPKYRTLDRDQSDYYTLSGGGRYEWTGQHLSFYVDASAMNTIYSDYIFLTRRLALIAQGGLRLRW